VARDGGGVFGPGHNQSDDQGPENAPSSSQPSSPEASTPDKKHQPATKTSGARVLGVGAQNAAARGETTTTAADPASQTPQGQAFEPPAGTFQCGTNPDGSHYSDPVSFVSYFNGGDAVHYFPRGSYGWQQSLGCVELPYYSAQRAYPYLTYGSLVTVRG